jgi:Cu/Ag efflux protein CusF
MKMKQLLVLVAALALAAPALAQHSHGAGAAGATASAAALTDGEVRKVDKAARKVTIKHGPIANVDMPAMTMAFDVKDPALLDKVKDGEKVRFRVEKEGANYVVTRLEPAR